jgi:two-component system response regulator AtoC
VLQEGSFSRLGGKQDVRVNVRIIAATNRDLKKAVEEGRFREDIYYRLNVVNIHVPLLSERPEDIQYLFEYFLETYNEKYAKHINVDKNQIYPLLITYPWPGNIRELKNLVKRVVILGNVEDLERYLTHVSSVQTEFRPEIKDSSSKGQTIKEPHDVDVSTIIPLKDVAKRASVKAEREMILRALHGTNWNKKKAADLLQISYKAMLYKIKECGIEK